MGTWGYKTFENDAAADWLYDLEEATKPEFVLQPLQALIRSRGKADLDDCMESLAAAEVLAGARYEPPRNLPRIARSWVKRVALVPRDADLKMAIRAVAKIEADSELADEWQTAGKLSAWQKEVKRLVQRLTAALRAPVPSRQNKPKVQRETLAEMIIAVASDPAGKRREELRKKLAGLSDPDRPVGGKLDGQRLNPLTPLHWVASRGMIPEARLLIARGAKVNKTVFLSGAPMDFALKNNHPQMVALLLEAGADRAEALFTAIGDDRLEIIKMIIAAGIDLNTKREGGWTAVQWAALHGSRRTLELLLGLGADANCTDDDGDTPLHHAAGEWRVCANEDGRYLAVVKLLVQHGADVNARGREGKTPLDVAEEANDSTIARFLRKRGARNGQRDRGKGQEEKRAS